MPQKTAVKPKKKSRFEPVGYKLLVKRSRTGLGLFAGEDIKKGTCIIEYVGREISKEEQYTSRSRYLFEINSKKTIDGAVRSNTARYINHSCAPNCEIDIHRARVFVMALRHIKAGEELNYDYDTEYFDEYIKPKGCLCQKCSPSKK
jgi:SET domain-containing protein